ncbi:hypothetical protein [Malikia sp.]|uniref:DUF6414 family protein n=1 Tax=Malikia sp. TaxID=2070706 RepID=UPI002610CBF1|nr:hypothetical protein [Malikia sp.]MDD2729871.1 hypothetical protein [Malikia sp.]
MQSYLYLNENRIKSVFSQLTDGLVTKTNVESSKSVEAGIGASLLGMLTPSLKATKAGKQSTEKVMAPENMVAHLIKIIPKTGKAKLLTTQEDWRSVYKGDLVVFHGELEFDSFGHTKQELWDASCEELGQRKLRHDLRLKGQIGGKYVEIPFSSNWVTGPSQFTMLCHAEFDSLEGLAIVMTDPESKPVMLQPLAFGNCFIAPDGETEG